MGGSNDRTCDVDDNRGSVDGETDRTCSADDDSNYTYSVERNADIACEKELLLSLEHDRPIA